MDMGSVLAAQFQVDLEVPLLYGIHVDPGVDAWSKDLLTVCSSVYNVYNKIGNKPGLHASGALKMNL